MTATSYTVTWLEMPARPDIEPGPLPPGMTLAPVAADGARFMDLYRKVGADWEWTDWLTRSDAEVEAFAGHPDRQIHLVRDGEGAEAGFFMTDHAAPPVADLAYFGLMPGRTGVGLGRTLIGHALAVLWGVPGTERVTVNTCTLDHPAALPLYRSVGFVPVRREVRERAAR